MTHPITEKLTAAIRAAQRVDEREGREGLGVAVKQGQFRITRTTIDVRGKATTVELTNWLSKEEVLHQLWEMAGGEREVYPTLNEMLDDTLDRLRKLRKSSS